MTVTWTHDDDAVAASEGWGLFDSMEHGWEIQKIDEPEEGEAQLEGDDTAWVLVAQRAAAGSAVHLKALEFLGERNNDARIEALQAGYADAVGRLEQLTLMLHAARGLSATACDLDDDDIEDEMCEACGFARVQHGEHACCADWCGLHVSHLGPCKEQ